MKRWILTSLLLATPLSIGLLPAPAAAGSFEISPFVGTRFGGDFESDDDFGFDDFGLEIDDGSSYGLSVAFGLGRNWQLELLWSRQETELVEDFGFFDPSFPIADIEVDYYHVGVVYQWAPGQLRPYVVGSLGATSFRPDEPGFDSETRPSASLGVGVKYFFNESFGLKLEARGFTTLVSSDDEVFCDRFGCATRYGDEYVIQGEAKAGLVLAF